MLSGIDFVSIRTTLADIVFSVGDLESISSTDQTSEYALSFRSSQIESFTNSTFINLECSTIDTGCVDSNGDWFGYIGDVLFQNANNVVLYLIGTEVDTIENLHVLDSYQAIHLKTADIGVITNSSFENLGTFGEQLNAGIGVHSSNLVIQNTSFIMNSGIEGAAINIDCSYNDD